MGNNSAFTALVLTRSTETAIAMNPPELKPCPFCGGEPRRVKTETELPGGRKFDVMWKIECFVRECGASMISLYPLDAAESAWNRRVSVTVKELQ